MTKRRKNHDEQRKFHQQDDDYIPVPIQTFLWRQTSPFVRPFLGKARDLAQIEQRDACKLFERVIITNNIWGQSPSLTDAIASIDRWRLIKVSFPFVLQCTAALLNNKLIKDRNFNRLGGNEAKMMYTLQWILMNASEECADSENEAKANANNVAIAAATAASLLKPTSTSSATCHQQPAQGSSSSAASAGLDQPQQLQQQQHQQAQQQSTAPSAQLVSGYPQLAAAALSGSASSCANQSIMIPAANAAASVVAVAAPSGMSTLQMQPTLPSSSSVSPIGSSTPTKPLNPPAASYPSNYLLPIYSIHMFVYHFAPIMESLKHSDFLTSNQRLEIGTALWEPLFNHQLPNIQCLIAQVKPQKNRDSSSAFFPSGSTNQNDFILQASSINAPNDRRRSSSMMQDQSQFGDVFLGGPSNATATTSIVGSKSATQSMIDSKHKRIDLIEQSHHRKTTTTSGTNFSTTSQQQIDIDQSMTDTSYATHLDIAVLRCLFITDWPESGVFWAITFLSNRMAELCYSAGSEIDMASRPRSKSLSDLDRDDLKDISSKTELSYDKIGHKMDRASLPKVVTLQDEEQSSNSDNQPRNKEEQPATATSRLLRVEDADNMDSVDGSRFTRSPVRRLSFSSGMQTLANQIRKTSKRVKKLSDNQQTGDSVTSESQLSINQGQSIDVKSMHSSRLTHPRRSSSADDLNTIQISALSQLHTDTMSRDARLRDGHLTESNPVITVTANNQLKNKDESMRAQQQKSDKKQQGANSKNDRRFLLQRLYAKSIKRLDCITRSQTVPRNLHYSAFETKKDRADTGETLGAIHYIDDYGRIDPIVVLKVLHSISQRESVCSQRVCDKILSLALKLINLGIMKENFNFSRRTSQQKDLTKLLTTRQHVFTLLDNKSHVLNMDSDQRMILQQSREDAAVRTALIHKILIDIIFRLYHHLGCPNHCGMESTVDHHHQTSNQTRLMSINSKTIQGNDPSSIKNLRNSLRNALECLSNLNRQNFIRFVQCLITDRALQQVIDILHSVLGFCRSDYLKNLEKHQQVVATSATNNIHSQTVQFMPTSSTSVTNLQEQQHTRAAHTGGSLSSTHSDGSEMANATRQSTGNQKFSNVSSTLPGTQVPGCIIKKSSESVETIIILNSCKQLISRMASVNKDLKLQENTSLYCDIRRFISFIRENYSGVFRSIVLSALIDCAKIINQQQRLAPNEMVNQKKVGDFTCPPSDDESLGENITHLKRNAKMTAENNDTIEHSNNKPIEAFSLGSSVIQQSPLAHNQDANLMQHRTSFGSCRFYPQDHPKYNKQLASIQSYNQQDQQYNQNTGILSLSSKAKKKFEQVFGGKPLNRVKQNSSHLGEELAQSVAIVTIDGDQAEDASRRASIAGHQSMGSFQESNFRPVSAGANTIQHIAMGHQLTHIQMLRQNQQICDAVRSGMSNFSFLMESCSPGDFLDPAMLAALLDLKSPIAVRAAIYLECANFVHRCNRGQWPSWMRMNVSAHRNSLSGGIQSSSASKLRKSSSIQRTARNNTLMYRAAGRAFYSWAEAIGARLEEIIFQEQESNREKETTIAEDPENDVLSDQGTVTNSQTNDNQINSDIDFYQVTLFGSNSPFALKMAACQLLFEVTTFLRETYRYLPPTIVHHQAAGSKPGDKMSSIYDVSRAVTANRRWSMALSSLGFGQLPATLNALSAGATNAQPVTGSQHLKNPTTTAISEHPERRISFILHETNDENDQTNSQDASNPNQTDSTSQHAVTSPLAPSVNTAEQQQDAMKKMTAGRHLSQSSASSAVVVAAATCLLRSSGVIDNQSHRRKSIKLRKTTQDKDKGDKKTKFAQDLDEENENSSVSDAGIRRTDSLRSRRRVSGISERSDTSDRVNNLHLGCHEVGQAGACELSGDDSAGNGSCDDAYANEAAEKLEADESRIMSNMPWFKAIAVINSSIDRNCVHYPICKQNCYKIHQNMCKRLISCVQSIYQDSDDELNYASSVFDHRLANFINLGNQQKVSSQDFKNAGVTRAGSECSGHLPSGSDSDIKRKDRKFKKVQQLDSTYDDASHISPKNKKQQDKTDNKMQSMKSFHLDSIASANGANSILMSDALKALTAAKAKKRATAQRSQEEPPIVKYIKSNVKSLLHCPMSSFLKGAVILPRDTFVEMIHFSWSLLLEDDQQLSRTAAVGFIIASIKCPSEAAKLLLDELECDDASRKIAAINKFHVIWDARYQCWPRLEDGAFVHFKMAPPSIEFTLPSPKIAQESKPVVDPPWMPRKTSNVEEVTIGQDQTVQKSFVTATKTRRKQQIEILTKALREKHDKLREDRENYHITSAPITLYAAYEPTLGNQPGVGDDLEGAGTNTDEDTQQENRALLQMKTAQALFPTCLCQAAIVMINLLDDSRVTYEGSAVYEIANKVIWSCLVEDPALFLRHFFERLTRQNQNTIFQVLRRLIRFMPRLPPQAAYTLYNYLIGFIIYYIRCPVESSQKLIADTLSVLCLVVPSVYGLFLKDLKQILRKEQCDHNLLITANVPSAKKIIVHGSDSSGIPSQFPIDESTQFYHILVDSLEFFGIDKPKQNEYFLIDVRTNYMHNLHSYVRDYYSFKRSQHPQLQLINMNPDKAFDILQKQELINQFLEFGKVSMSLSIVKSSYMAVQRVLFLHEELMKLPTFPRTALMTNFSLFRGPLGHQVFSMDRIHKICWVRVIARMFELTSGFFLQLGDIHLFLNAISGIFVLHCEEASVSRLCLATFINATYQFKNIFATDGFMPVMATIVQVYSNHQNNQLLCRSIEFVCKQFYIMHRKPFLLQLFGSVASRLNTSEIVRQNQANYPLATNQPAHSGSSTINNFNVSDPSRISPTAFFKLLQSLEKAFKDPLDILELVEAEKPLRAIDFCYQQDKEAIEILDIISLCVTVTAYASESPRSTQMLIILEAVVPLYMKHLQASTSKKAGQSMGKQAHKDELQKIQSISICIRTLIVNCEGLTRNFNGPLPSIDFRNSSIRRTGNKSSQQRGQNNSAGSPIDLYNEEPSYSGPEKGKRDAASGSKNTNANAAYKSTRRFSSDESEITRGEFIVPRDTLLNLVAEFLSLSTGRLVESAKKYVELHQKHSSYELLDIKSHLRLAEVANSLLKFASTDPSVMACRGLTRYMNEILPNTEWRQEAIRPALIMILKRLDKTFNRIAKKTWVKRSTDWEGAKQLLKGAYLTFIKHPYIVHLPHLKSLINCCQNIILSDGLHSNAQVSTTNLFHGFSTNQAAQPGVMVSQSASAIPHQTAADKQSGNLLSVGTSHFAPGASLSPSGASTYNNSAPNTAYSAHNQQLPSFAAVTAAASLAERLAGNSAANPITSQGFNSVTIRLIAMQLLQTGDSQTLESFIGNSMNAPEKLESLLLNLIYPMCIRVCSGAREAPKLRICDIMFTLNIVLNMLAPQSSSSKSCSATSSSPKTATDTSQFILSKITTTIGSTQTGATALGIVGSSSHSTSNANQQIQHQDGLKIGFLGLKILCVCFESQLASEWIRISRVIRDLAMQSSQPGGPLWDFLDFVATYRFPLYILLLPMVKCDLAKKVKCDKFKDNSAHNLQCLRMIESKLHGVAPTVCRSKSFLFVSLTAELRMLKEQLITKRRLLLDGDRQATSSHPAQQSFGNIGASNVNQSGQYGETSQQGDHFTAYHRLSAAIASFANQGAQGKLTPSASGSTGQTGTSAALKGTCFAAQLATSAPIGPQISDGSSGTKNSMDGRNEPSQSSIRLSTAKSREEARKVMNTILRRTSYPHNQNLLRPDEGLSTSGERKNSQPSSPSSTAKRQSAIDIESSGPSQIIMDPAMLMAAFPAPRKSTAEGSGILKQLIQSIDRQNQKQQQQKPQTSSHVHE